MTFSGVIVLHDEFSVLEHFVMLLNSLRFPGNVGCINAAIFHKYSRLSYNSSDYRPHKRCILNALKTSNY